MHKIRNTINENAELVNIELNRYLSGANIGNSVLAEAMRYSVQNGGKRLRAGLALEFCRMFNGDITSALPYAAAIELGHAASLIHDDMPCMDNDEMRRGKPSCHLIYGDSAALLAGDALLSLGFELVVSNPYLEAEINQKAASIFAHNVGIHGMCLGQQLDIEGSVHNINELLKIYDLKTGLPIKIAAMLGCLAAGKMVDELLEKRISEYSLNIGRAYQVMDDLLDVYGTKEQIGKPVGSDEKNGKITVTAFMKKKEAVLYVQELLTKASEVFGEMENGETICKFPLYLGKLLDLI